MSTISSQSIKLTETGSAINGAICLPGALFPTQPLFTWKTFSMVGAKQFPPIHRLWTGYVPNALSGGLAEGIAFVTYKVGTDCITKNDKNKLTDSNNIALSLVAGTLGAPINASLEQGMIRQQLAGGSLYHHMMVIQQTSGWKGVFKATNATAWRDGLFTCGVFAFNDYAKEQVEPFIANPFYQNLAAGMLAGMTAGALSTPFDLLKTLVQSDTKGEYPTCLQTAKKIVQKEGFLGLYRGAIYRSMTIGPVICMTAMLKNIVPNYFPNSLKEDK